MVALYGKVEADNRSGELQIIQPDFEILEEPSENGSPDAAEKKLAESLEIGRIVPIYEAIGQGRLTSRWFRRVIHTALENLPPDMPDAIPAVVRQAPRPDLAARSAAESALAGAWGEPRRSAILAHTGPRPPDF